MATEKQEEETVQTAIRVPKSWLDRLDRLAERSVKPGGTLPRAEMMRQSLYRGLVELEAEGGKKR